MEKWIYGAGRHNSLSLTLCVCVCTNVQHVTLPPWGLWPLSLAAKLLVECIKIRDAERARLAIWWKQKLPVHFYDVFMLSRLFLMWPVRAARDLQRPGGEQCVRAWASTVGSPVCKSMRIDEWWQRAACSGARKSNSTVGRFLVFTLIHSCRKRRSHQLFFTLSTSTSVFNEDQDCLWFIC